MRAARPTLVLAAAAASLALSACASAVDGTPTGGQSTNVPTGFPASTSAPAPSGSAAGPSVSGSSAPGTAVPSGSLSPARAQAALLTAADLGKGFRRTSASADDPLPCTPNQPTLEKRFPAQVRVQSTFAGAGGQAAIEEQIERFESTSKAATVLATAEHGLACGTGTLAGAPVTISGPTLLTDQLAVPSDKAEAWSLQSTQVVGAIVVVQLGRQLVEFSFGAAPSVTDSQIPDVPTLVETGAERVAAALK